MGYIIYGRLYYQLPKIPSLVCSTLRMNSTYLLRWTQDVAFYLFKKGWNEFYPFQAEALEPGYEYYASLPANTTIKCSQ